MKKLIVGACVAMGVMGSAAQAQTYPTKPIRLVVPYTAGGATDFVARAVGERLSNTLGQPVIVDNKAGAAGALGAAEVARAAPDGYTMLMTITDSQINNVGLFKSLAYNPQKDFAFVTQIVRSPALISVNKEMPVKNMAEFKRLAAERKGGLSYSSWSVGGLGHLAVESLNRDLKADMVHVPQKGEGPVVSDLLSKTVHVGVSSVATAKQHVEAGNLTPLAVLGRERSSALPQVPTMKELGFTDPLYDSNVWVGVFLPAKAPAALVQKLAADIRDIVGSPEMTKLLQDRGFEVMNTTPDQFQAAFTPEFKVITSRIRELGIDPQ